MSERVGRLGAASPIRRQYVRGDKVVIGNTASPLNTPLICTCTGSVPPNAHVRTSCPAGIARTSLTSGARG